MQTFNLIPFPTNDLPQIRVTGEIERREGALFIRYAATGEIDSVRVPAPTHSPSRRNELWKTTCFEFFLAVPGKPEYWEFNLSPSGDWNAYRMDEYRRIGFREDTLVRQIQIAVREEAGELRLSAQVGLDPLFEADQILEAGISAVIRTKNGTETYWALRHPNAHADFHHREGFEIRI
ncbi:MAG: DOMON-like domain-containing protein [Chloroflexi bacterium]|nr:DOMON-like domain-containing protein [Chloroflexota bacterium]